MTDDAELKPTAHPAPPHANLPKFNFENMIAAFEAVTFTHDGPRALPDTLPFTHALAEVALLFDHLGTGFGFIRHDITTKVDLLNARHSADPVTFASLQDAVNREIEDKTTADKRAKNWPSTARTVLRLMWATKFLHVLMRELHKAYQPGSNLALKACVSKAYQEALEEHHPWIVRKAVGVAVNLLPTKERFLQTLGVDVSKRDEYLERVEKSFGPLVEKTYAFYAEHKMLNLP